MCEREKISSGVMWKRRDEDTECGRGERRGEAWEVYRGTYRERREMVRDMRETR